MRKVVILMSAFILIMMSINVFSATATLNAVTKIEHNAHKKGHLYLEEGWVCDYTNLAEEILTATPAEISMDYAAFET